MKARLIKHFEALIERILLLALALAILSFGTLAQPESLTITAAFAGRELSPRETIELRLSRPLAADDGKPSVFIGTTDVSDLITISRILIRYQPQPLPLPPGETEVTIWLVSDTGQWMKLGSFPLRVSAQTVVTPETASTPAIDVRETAKRHGLVITPRLNLGLKSQPAESHFPETPRQGRSTFTDFTMQGSLSTGVERGLFNWQSQFDVVGSSYRPEALRYALLGNEAPRIDLAGYQSQLNFGKTRLSAGNITQGRQRHLINNFASRGISLSRQINARADFSIAAQNSTSIVGWDNFLGINRRDHQILSSTFGYDLLTTQADQFSEKNSVNLRIETSALSGSALPFNNLNQSRITDAEKSRGGGLRILASDAADRFHLDAGWARSRSFNPYDPQLANPLLDQGTPISNMRETTSSAHYLDVRYTALQNYSLTANTKTTMQISYQQERIAPLFRSVGAAELQPNKLLRQIGLNGNLGEVSVSFSHLRFNDNLDEIPSLLKTMTRRNLLMIGGPMRALIGKSDSSSTQASAWLPTLSYSYDRTHQFGAALPVKGEFKAPQIPNQVGIHQTFAAEWQGKRWRYGYRLDGSSQNNFGEKRTGTRMRNLTHALTLGFAPHTAFGVNFELNRELSHSEDNNANKDPERNDHTWQYTLIMNWRPSFLSRRTATTMNLSNLSMHGFGAITRADNRRNTQFDWQWSWRFLGGEESAPSPNNKLRTRLRGQYFIRYDYRSAYTSSELLMQTQINRGHTLNTGINFSFF